MRVGEAIRSLRAVELETGKARHAGVGLLLLLTCGLAACSSTRSAETIAAPRTVDATEAMIMPAPGGPTVISVIEERFSDAVEQKVILGTDASNEGQNYLAIRLYGPMERETQGTKKLGYRSFAAVTMNNEAIRAMPGVPMKASTLFLRNNYGPFGYSFGQSASGDSCIYGWQQLRSTDAERRNFRNVGAIQIRLRLCESGASEKQLLGVMYGYTVTASVASDQWNPFGQSKDISSDIAKGDPIYPEDSELASPPAVVTVQPVRRKPVVVRKADDAAVQEENVEDENAAKRIVDVPSPDANDSETTSDGTTTDVTTQSPVTVPSPGCQDGSTSCN